MRGLVGVIELHCLFHPERMAVWPQVVEGAKPSIELFTDAGVNILQPALLFPSSRGLLALVVLHVKGTHHVELDVVEARDVVFGHKRFKVTRIFMD